MPYGGGNHWWSNSEKLDPLIPSFYELETEHGPACSSCAETMIGLGDDGEMELKKEFHGKVLYLDGDYGYQSKKEDLAKDQIIEVLKDWHNYFDLLNLDLKRPQHNIKSRFTFVFFNNRLV